MQLEIFTIQFLDKQHGDLFNVTWFFRDEYMARNFANEIIFSQGIIGRSEDYRSIYASQKHTEIRSVKKGWSDSSFPACRAPNGMLFENAIAEEAEIDPECLDAPF